MQDEGRRCIKTSSEKKKRDAFKKAFPLDENEARHPEATYRRARDLSLELLRLRQSAGFLASQSCRRQTHPVRLRSDGAWRESRRSAPDGVRSLRYIRSREAFPRRRTQDVRRLRYGMPRLHPQRTQEGWFRYLTCTNRRKPVFCCRNDDFYIKVLISI